MGPGLSVPTFKGKIRESRRIEYSTYNTKEIGYVLSNNVGHERLYFLVTLANRNHQSQVLRGEHCPLSSHRARNVLLFSRFGLQFAEVL